MELESGRSSTLSERHRSMVESRANLLSRISRPGSNGTCAVQANIDAVQAETRESMVVIQANIGAMQTNILEVVQCAW